MSREGEDKTTIISTPLKINVAKTVENGRNTDMKTLTRTETGQIWVIKSEKLT